MSRYRKDIFPISLFHSCVPDNRRLQELILPLIEREKNQNTDPPDGWLTTNLITSFENDGVNTRIFQDPVIAEEIKDQYMSVLGTFFDKNWEINISNMWFNYYENGEYQEGHTHMGSFDSPIHFACVHFISFDPDIHAPLTFSDPIATLRSTSLEFDSTPYDEKFMVKAKEGDFVMFPCYLEHEVKSTPPTPGKPRITISFNINVIRYGDED